MTTTSPASYQRRSYYRSNDMNGVGGGVADIAIYDDDDAGTNDSSSLRGHSSGGEGANTSSGQTGGGGGDRWTSNAMGTTARNSGSGVPSSASTSARDGAADNNGVAESRDSAARKQNSACDACRNRKVRCHRTPGEEKCNHCRAKGIDCTTIYVQLATTGAKRPVKRGREAGGLAGTDGADPLAAKIEEIPAVVRYLLLRDGEYADAVHGLSYAETSGRRHPPTTAAEARLINATARQEFVSSLLETYFSTVHIRYPILDPQEFLQRFHYQPSDLGGAPADVLTAVLLAWGAKFSRHPIIMADRRETADYELTPAQRFKRSIVNPLSNQGASIERSGAGGQHDSMGPRDGSRVMGRSRIAEDLIVKAQEVLDRNKAHRVATLEHAKASIIIQALFWQQASSTENDDAVVPSQLRSRKRRGVYICNGMWVNCAISHLFEMRVHLRSTVEAIANEAQRSQVAMTWWLASLFDSHMSAFYRRKPMLALEDSSTLPPAPPRTNPDGGPTPVASEQGYRIWLNSSVDQCEMMRAVYFTLWTPRAYEDGISARKLEKLVSMAYQWRSNHLGLVGAPDPDWPSHWKFADAITACASDVNYQIVWILMWQAVDEYGIAELKASSLAQYNIVGQRHSTTSGLPATMAEMELDQSKVSGMRNAIYDEALKGALRCAQLSRMLCDVDYLQNEAGIMKFALCEAGYMLTRFRRPEVYNIIDGLRQYGQAFEECYEQADVLERLASEFGQRDPRDARAMPIGGVGPPSTSSPNDHNLSPYGGMSGLGGAAGNAASANAGMPAYTEIADHGRDYNYNHPGTHLFATQIMNQHGSTPSSSSASVFRQVPSSLSQYERASQEQQSVHRSAHTLNPSSTSAYSFHTNPSKPGNNFF